MSNFNRVRKELGKPPNPNKQAKSNFVDNSNGFAPETPLHWLRNAHAG